MRSYTLLMVLTRKLSVCTDAVSFASLSLSLCLCLCLCLSGFEALLVNHPTGVMNMRSNPSLPPVNVTITFTGTMPTRVSVRRVDATHANALPAYQASEC